MINLVQLRSAADGRCAAVADRNILRLLRTFQSLYACAQAAIETGRSLEETASADVGDEELAYDEVYSLQSRWRLLPSFDHPEEPARCLVSGTGLTHRKSAANRNAMHQAGDAVTDSMRIYQLGAEGGRPAQGNIGAQPEWFYKGTGDILRAHGEPLDVPGYAEDGGEEPEIAGVYLIAPNGEPLRVGFTTANEFSDHKMERINYLYLAPSKLRSCAIGPELVSGAEFGSVRGTVSVRRGGAAVWSHEIETGERNMVHSLANIEHHQFKYAPHRRPGDVHIHFFGADAFSFGEGIELADGDMMEVCWEGFGRPLRNPAKIEARLTRPVAVRAL